MRNSIIVTLFIIALAVGIAIGEAAWKKNHPPAITPPDKNTVSITHEEYQKLKEDAALLPAKERRNEHLATNTTDLAKENIGLQDKLIACEKRSDTQHMKDVLLMQDEQLTKFRNELAELQQTCK